MKSNRPVIFFLLVCSLIASYTQGQTWQWAKQANGVGNTEAMCTDLNGNAYVTGYYTGPLVLGSDTLFNYSGPYQDVFISKYDISGNLMWARNGNGYADMFGVTTDMEGNVYIVGDFYKDSLVLGSSVLVNPHTGPQVSNIFFVKYDSLGNVVWAKNLGGINNDQATGACADANGNIYITGNFTGDSLVFDGITIQHLGDGDGFIAKFNGLGNALWIRSVGSAYLAGSTGICTDATGNAYMTGYFLSSSMFLGNYNTILNSPYSGNVFLSKYDSSGNMRWTQYAGGNNGNGAAGISADALGNIYMTGYYSDTIAFNNDALVSNGYQSVFTAKFDTSGNEVWARSAGGTYVDQPAGIITAGNGNSYVTGYLESDTFYFGNIDLLNTSGSQVTFVLNYDANGNTGWAVAPVGRSDNYATAISYSLGNVYIAGTFANSDIMFDMDTLVIDPVYSQSANIFVAKLDSDISTGISTIAATSDKIIVYPNPSTGGFYFKGMSNGSRIDVYDLIGENVYSAVANSDNYPVNLPGKASGVYIYRINDTNGISLSSGKIVIQ